MSQIFEAIEKLDPRNSYLFTVTEALHQLTGQTLGIDWQKCTCNQGECYFIEPFPRLQ